MAVPLATCTKEEQRSVIRFLSSEGLKPIEVHRRMKVQYGDARLSLQQVYEWSRKFSNGVTSVTDALCPGQVHHVVTPESTTTVEAIVMENHMDEIAANLNISQGSVHQMIHDVLRFKKCLQDGCHGSSLQNSKSNALMPVKNFCCALKQKVMVSLRESLQETKRGYTTTNPKQREQARNVAIPHHQNPRSFRYSHLQGDYALFWDEQGIILEHYTPRGNTITSGSYSNMLKKSSSACNQIKAMWTSDYWCHFATRQCAASNCPCNSCNHQ